MDELDLIKKDWQKRNEDLPKYTQDELMPMLHKKSSSSVKWIFIISILEFVFWLGIDVLVSSKEYMDSIENQSFLWFLKILTVLNYVVLFGFIYLFCKNYLRIQVTDSARKLMKQIIKTRKSVKYYVRYNIALFIIMFVIGGARAIMMQTTFNTLEFWIICGIMVFILLIVVGLLILFYRVLYGILTRRLYKNYKILNQMEL
ncbi:hypothetical protein [Psychroflexus lacisalsi]|jgi:hypothetical protein|uniref:Beta-carotene 15,15'-monooxygenase n=1 Tax=Psychroflexus lacisalsi TaxID=503928 RepID=A0ABP3VQ21_9FLAO|nr:hypothetical protein [Psychroflexus lacisalsi]MBZ9620637.1 hypothetical protein [Psychroflexus lacisalsi]